MQNSKLSTKIIPSVNESWQRFISREKSNLEESRTATKKENKRIKELNSYIKKIELIKSACEKDITEIFNYRTFFLFIDQSLENVFNGLEYLRDNDNLDNDAVLTMYNRIINSPKIVQLSEELNRLQLKVELMGNQDEPLEDLIRGKKYDQVFIQDLLEKTDFGDKTKKDILMFPIINAALKQTKIKKPKEPVVSHKQVLLEVYRNKIKELCAKYQSLKEEKASLLNEYFKLYQGMSKEEKAICDAYAANPSEARANGYGNEVLAKIYMVASFKLRSNIESCIEGLGELDTEGLDLGTEISFLEALITEFNSTINQSEELFNFVKKCNEETENNLNVFFAFNEYRRLILDIDLLESNKSSINAFIEKVEDNINNLVDGVNVNPMLGVNDAEDLLGRKIYLIGKRNYKLAYIRVSNSMLVLSLGDSSDTKFDSNINRIVREYFGVIKKQIEKIEQKDEEYFEMQRNVRKIHLQGGKTI